MCDLKVERQIEQFDKDLFKKYNIIFYLLYYNSINKVWDFTLINTRSKTIYLPFNYRSKKIKYTFYYQTKYHRFKLKI